MTHTPGPWNVRMDKQIGKVPTAIEGPTGRALCQFTWTMHQHGINHYFADARLIAAAPELLAMLELIVNYAEASGSTASWLPAAKAAISRAEGEL